MMHMEWQFRLNNVCKIFTSIIYIMVIEKIEYSYHFKRFWHAPVIATCGF